jgi:hypothetical protein
VRHKILCRVVRIDRRFAQQWAGWTRTQQPTNHESAAPDEQVWRVQGVVGTENVPLMTSSRRERAGRTRCHSVAGPDVGQIPAGRRNELPIHPTLPRRWPRDTSPSSPPCCSEPQVEKNRRDPPNGPPGPTRSCSSETRSSSRSSGDPGFRSQYRPTNHRSWPARTHPSVRSRVVGRPDLPQRQVGPVTSGPAITSLWPQLCAMGRRYRSPWC